MQPAELRRREQRRLEAEQMVEAAAVVRDRGPGGFVGLDHESADALGALLKTLAEDWLERPTSPRVWEHAARTAQRLVHDLIREPGGADESSDAAAKPTAAIFPGQLLLADRIPAGPRPPRPSCTAVERASVPARGVGADADGTPDYEERCTPRRAPAPRAATTTAAAAAARAAAADTRAASQTSTAAATNSALAGQTD